jgi:hypothetical protein
MDAMQDQHLGRQLQEGRRRSIALSLEFFWAGDLSSRLAAEGRPDPGQVGGDDAQRSGACGQPRWLD